MGRLVICFQKSNGSGGLRYYSLYSKPGLVYFYYALNGASKHQFLKFNIDLSDDREYRVLLTVALDDSQEGSLVSSVALQVDDVQVGATRQIDGVLDDCDPDGDCKLYVGQRSDSGTKVYGFEGEIFEAAMHNHVALQAYPL